MKPSPPLTPLISEVEKCMLAMVDDFELNRMREWERDIDKLHDDKPKPRAEAKTSGVEK